MINFDEMFEEERNKLVKLIEHHQHLKEMYEDLSHNHNLKLIEAQKKLDEFDHAIRTLNNLPSY